MLVEEYAHLRLGYMTSRVRIELVRRRAELRKVYHNRSCRSHTVVESLDLVEIRRAHVAPTNLELPQRGVNRSSIPIVASQISRKPLARCGLEREIRTIDRVSSRCACRHRLALSMLNMMSPT